MESRWGFPPEAVAETDARKAEQKTKPRKPAIRRIQPASRVPLGSDRRNRVRGHICTPMGIDILYNRPNTALINFRRGGVP